MTISRSEPMGLASRLPSATRSTSRSGRASSQAPPRRQVVKSIWVSSYMASEPGGVAGEAAVASQRPTARERAATSDTASTSRPKRWENLTSSDRGVPTPGRTSLPGSRTQKPMATARNAGSEAKRARRGAWSSSRTKVRIWARRVSRAWRRSAPTICATSVGMTWRLGWMGMRKARRSSEKPAPRRVAVTPPAPRSRRGSRSRSSSSWVSTSPPPLSMFSSNLRSTGGTLSISSRRRSGELSCSQAGSSERAMGGLAGRPR